MKNLLIIHLIMLSYNGISQYNWNNPGNRFSNHFFMGLSAGNEYFVSLPKFSYVARFDLLNKYGHSELDDYEP